jgi:hypothetical protein
VPQISVLDLHYYLWNAKNAAEYCEGVHKIIQRWDAQLPQGKKPYPFFIGEIARYSSGKKENLIISKADAQMMREACKMLSEYYGKRFLSVTAHGPIEMWQNGKAWYHEDY